MKLSNVKAFRPGRNSDLAQLEEPGGCIRFARLVGRRTGKSGVAKRYTPSLHTTTTRVHVCCDVPRPAACTGCVPWESKTSGAPCSSAAAATSTCGHDEAAAGHILFVIVATIAVVLLITGGFVQSLNFLLWVGVVLVVLAVIAFLLRMISGRRNVQPPASAGSGQPAKPSCCLCDERSRARRNRSSNSG